MGISSETTLVSGEPEAGSSRTEKESSMRLHIFIVPRWPGCVSE
jgi:hypothetical protein